MSKSCCWLLIGYLWLSMATFATVSAAQNSTSASTSSGTVDLKTMLENGLRARRKADLAFIGAVVVRVEEGQLPERLVKSTFEWARRKNPRFPFPFFHRALVIQSKKLGVAI